MSPFFRLLVCMLSAIAVMAASPRPAHAQTRSLSEDCAASPYALDCACVTSEFNRLTARYNSQQTAVADKYMRLMMGIPFKEDIENEQAIALQIIHEIMPVQMQLTDTCKATGGGEDPSSPSQLAMIATICRDSAHYVDCSCVSARYQKAAAGVPSDAQAFARAIIGTRLNVSVSPSYEQIPATTMIQYSSIMDSLDGFAEACTAPTPAAINAYHNHNTAPSPTPTMEARAAASGEDSMRMWCQAVDGKSPAYCACQVQVIRDVMPENTFRYNAESMKSLALVELGHLDGPERFNHTARTLGYHDKEAAKQIYNETAASAQIAYQVGREVCDLVENSSLH